MATDMNGMMREQLLERRRKLEEATVSIPQKDELERLMKEVDSALERMDRGTYGLCEVCHEPIEVDALIADPLLQFCLGHLTQNQQRALEADLVLARQIQDQLLPEQGMRHEGWDVSYHFEPAGLVSGDYCDLIPADSGNFYFILGDVSGKGIAASLLMSHLHAMFRSLLGFHLPLEKIMEQASRVFCKATLPTHYATLICGNAGREGEVEVSNAGHPPALWVRGDAIESIAATGLPIGAFCEGQFGVKKITLNRGDVLLFYSDGLSEMRNKQGTEYGQERICESLKKCSRSSASDVVRACLEDLRVFRGGAALQDDMTIMAIRRGE
jgi:sigma-B regulation protein RsbU (phosphoserine phosphatase)